LATVLEGDLGVDAVVALVSAGDELGFGLLAQPLIASSPMALRTEVTRIRPT
jgi:hypothetical protein